MSKSHEQNLSLKKHSHLTSRGKKVIYGTVATIGVLGMSAGLEATGSPAANHEAAIKPNPSPKPNAVATIRFNAGGSNWLAAEGLLALEGNPSEDPRHALQQLENAESTQDPNLSADNVQIGEVVEVPVSVIDPHGHYPLGQEVSSQNTVDIQLRPIEQNK